MDSYKLPTENTKYNSKVKYFFDNGYGISIVNCGLRSWGRPYEIAVLKGDISSYDLCYDTEITDDVLGHLTKDEALICIEKVKSL